MSELSLSDENDGLKGSGVYAESGIVLDRRPNGRWVLVFLVGSRRRLGRSAALRIVGLALRISDMVLFWDVDVLDLIRRKVYCLILDVVRRG